jgi:hypothetical protein
VNILHHVTYLELVIIHSTSDGTIAMRTTLLTLSVIYMAMAYYSPGILYCCTLSMYKYMSLYVFHINLPSISPTCIMTFLRHYTRICFKIMNNCSEDSLHETQPYLINVKCYCVEEILYKLIFSFLG